MRWLSLIHNSSAIETLIQALSNSDESIRYGALYALNSIGDENVIPHVVQLTSDDNILVSRMAFQILNQLKPLIGFRIAQSIVCVLQDPNPDLRRAALMVLEKAPIKVATQELLTQIEQILLKDKEDQVRCQAMITLGRLGKERSQNILINLIKNGDSDIPHTEIARILIETGNAAIVSELSGTLKNIDRQLRHQFVQPRFLCGLIAGMPYTKLPIIAFCLKYNVRIIDDGTVIVLNGRRLSCEEFQIWTATNPHAD